MSAGTLVLPQRSTEAEGAEIEAGSVGAHVGLSFGNVNVWERNGLISDQKKGGPLVEKLNRERNGAVG